MVNTRRCGINGRPRAEHLVPIHDQVIKIHTTKERFIVRVPSEVINEIGNELHLFRKDPTIELISMTDQEKVVGTPIGDEVEFDFELKGLPFKKRTGKVCNINSVVHQVKDHFTGKIVFHERNAMSILNK